MDIGPGDAKIAATTVCGVSAKLVIKATTRSIAVAEHLFAVDVNAETVDIRIVHRVDANAGTNLGNTVRDRLAALDAVQATTLLNAHDKVGTIVSAEGLLDRNAIARHGIDLESATELVCARGVVVLVTAFSAEMAIGAAGATPTAVGLSWDGKGVTVDSATFALLCAEGGMILNPVAALDGAACENGSGR